MRKSGIHFNSEVIVRDDCIATFREHLAETIRRVEATEPDTIEYIAYVSTDGRRCQVDQWFKDKKALVFHLNGEAAKMNDELFTMVEFFRLWLYTDIEDPEIQALFDSLNVGEKILMGPAFGGFDRSLNLSIPARGEAQAKPAGSTV
jgi:quinol monooxygenase YgiN